VNNAKAGSTVPVKFTLSEEGGAPDVAALFASQQVDCTTHAPTGLFAPVQTPGSRELKSANTSFHFNWKTDAAWAGTCRQLIIRLQDVGDPVALTGSVSRDRERRIARRSHYLRRSGRAHASATCAFGTAGCFDVQIEHTGGFSHSRVVSDDACEIASQATCRGEMNCVERSKRRRMKVCGRVVERVIEPNECQRCYGLSGTRHSMRIGHAHRSHRLDSDELARDKVVLAGKPAHERS
jgi:hypothetical protein